MKSIRTGSAIALTVALVAGGSTAYAADEKFPEVAGAPAWYFNALDAPYARADSTTGDQYSAQEDDEWHAAAWWYNPEGGAPGTTEPDIIIETLPKEDWEVGATDPNLITLSLNAAFPEMTDSIGTKLTNGVAIPTGKRGDAPVVTVPGDGIILAQRPARDCTVTNDLKDNDRFTVDLAMLGENQHKYLVNLTVEFGTRTWNAACANYVPVKPTEEKPKPKSEKAKKSDEIKKAVEPDAAPVEADADAEDSSTSWLWGIGFIGVLLIVGLVAWLFRRPRTRENDGTPIQPRDRSRPDRGASASRSRHGSGW